MDLQKNTENHRKSYKYSHRANIYDPNLSSAARYTPPPYQHNADQVQSVEVQPPAIEPEYTGVTYSNIIFVPNNNGNRETDTNNLIDQSQPYILSSDPRLFNAYIRPTGNEIESSQHYVEQQIIGATGDDHITNVHHNNLHGTHEISQEYQIQSRDSDFIEATVGEANENNTGEIIIRDSDGQYYRQIHNVYVNTDDPNSSVELVINEGIIENSYDNAPRHTFQNADYGIERQENIRNMILLPKTSDAEMLVNNSYGHIKNEYTVFEQMSLHNVNDGVSGELIQQTPSEVVMSHTEHQRQLDEREQQRILLESTMSPLLAAVNDITSREKQLQNYLSQSFLKKEHNQMETNHSDNIVSSSSSNSGHVNASKYVMNQTSNQQIFQNSPNSSDTNYRKNNLKIRNAHTASNEYVDINDMEFVEHRIRNTGSNSSSYHQAGTANDNCYKTSDRDEYLLVRRSQRKTKKDEELLISDKHVPCRAYASLPSGYLYISRTSDNDHHIFSKKDIPLRTKFGPLEGDLTLLSHDDIDILREETHRKLPLLLVDRSNIYDISNEYTSNWMRFVRLAHTFTEQNLLLYEIDNKLYFKTCQFIIPKQELKVGYSKEYADAYGLKYLEPNDTEKISILEKWPCFECDQKFETFDLLQQHLNGHEENKSAESAAKRKVRKRRPVRSKLSSRKVSGPTVRYACCFCSKVFSKVMSLNRHTEDAHSIFAAETPRNDASSVLKNSNGENKCDICCRQFTSYERLKKHRLTYCTSEANTLQCIYCTKRVLTASALAVHIKSHLFKSRLYHCVYCTERFQLVTELIKHVPIHSDNGIYNCEQCNKKFKTYSTVRKHARSVHTNVVHTCPECSAKFKSRTKLNDHLLVHSNVKDFLCSDCGKQFKRKDKLCEHVRAVHVQKIPPLKAELTDGAGNVSPESNKQPAIDLQTTNCCNKSNEGTTATTKPKEEYVVKLSPSDYQRFIYKCHDCMLGFKRRGMLVNHMAKRHPDVNIESVPELNLPILKAERFFYCQYCDKVYRSSSKRKIHILKIHPGAELPVSARGQSDVQEIPGIPNPTFSETIGNVTIDPHKCSWCHKQYASRGRLLRHNRKMHSNHIKDVDDNKLLKLSSVALEASLRDDFQFFDEKAEIPPSSIHHGQTHESVQDLDGIAKVDVNFKVVGSNDSSSGSNCDLNRLPQLFEEIDYINLKAETPSMSNQLSHHHHDHTNTIPTTTGNFINFSHNVS